MGLEEIRNIKAMGGVLKPKKTYVIPKKSKKRIKMEQDAVVNDEALDAWFEMIKPQLTGKCKHCGGKTWTIEDDLALHNDGDETVYKNKQEFYRHCIAHILPKAYFESVATHPLNFIELCFWSPSCHTNFDNLTLDIVDLNCFDEVITKFQAMYPFIAKAERKRIPQILMNYVEVDV
jgi:hypothetical protein